MECLRRRHRKKLSDFFYSEFKKGEVVINGYAKKEGLKVSPFIEKYLDSVLSKDYMATAGIGCDNMSCIVIVFKKKS